MYLICGLGNPGRQYASSRHNMGFIALDLLAQRLDIDLFRLRSRALVGEGRLDGHKIILAKPQTYMNQSGEAVRPLMDYYGLEAERLIVIYDDIDLEPGEIRVRRKGSAGTHNGMRSVIQQLGFDHFPRIRIGIGKSGIIPLEKYVLMGYTQQERPLLARAVQQAADAAVDLITLGAELTMRRYNAKATGGEEEMNR